MERRRFLAGTIAAGVAGLAGCGTAAGTVRPPRLPEDRLDEGGWERTSAETAEVFSRTVAGTDVSATAVTRVFDDAALRAEVREKTLGALDAPLSNFFASRIAFSPNLADVPVESAREELAARSAGAESDSTATAPTDARRDSARGPPDAQGVSSGPPTRSVCEPPTPSSPCAVSTATRATTRAR